MYRRLEALIMMAVVRLQAVDVTLLYIIIQTFVFYVCFCFSSPVILPLKENVFIFGIHLLLLTSVAQCVFPFVNRGVWCSVCKHRVKVQYSPNGSVGSKRQHRRGAVLWCDGTGVMHFPSITDKTRVFFSLNYCTLSHPNCCASFSRQSVNEPAKSMHAESCILLKL